MTISCYRCDECGKTVEDRYTQKNWIVIAGNITRMVGFERKTSFFDSRDRDFCSLKCLAKKIGAPVNK